MTPRLEDMLCDCAVIRTTFETFDLFSADDPIREEMQEIINDARANICRHCAELRADMAHVTMLDQPLDMQKFCEFMRTLLLAGYPRRRLDACMYLNVFQSVAKTEAGQNETDPLYRYELLPPLTAPVVLALSAKELTVTIFDDLLESIGRDANYVDQHAFDRNVFQKYIAVMFACYATTDPLFYA